MLARMAFVLVALMITYSLSTGCVQICHSIAWHIVCEEHGGDTAAARQVFANTQHHFGRVAFFVIVPCVVAAVSLYFHFFRKTVSKTA